MPPRPSAPCLSKAVWAYRRRRPSTPPGRRPSTAARLGALAFLSVWPAVTAAGRPHACAAVSLPCRWAVGLVLFGSVAAVGQRSAGGPQCRAAHGRCPLLVVLWQRGSGTRAPRMPLFFRGHTWGKMPRLFVRHFGLMAAR
jgi:hypothetical protein